MGELIDAARDGYPADSVWTTVGDLMIVVTEQGMESSPQFKEACGEVRAAIDRLILAVRAEMPCLSPPTGLTGRPHGGDCGLCLTCEARKALKETRGA